MTMTVFHKSGKCTQRAAPYNSGMTKVPLPLNFCILRKNHALLSRHYVSLDLGQLAENLKNDGIIPAVEAFTRALFLAVPAARQTTMSAANPWDYAIVTVRKGQRMQLPFNTAVRTSAKEPDMVENSIVALQKKFADAERMYGSLFGLKSKTEISLESGSVDELTDNLKNALEAL